MTLQDRRKKERRPCREFREPSWRKHWAEAGGGAGVKGLSSRGLGRKALVDAGRGVLTTL
jgi:hypothetical protein